MAQKVQVVLVDDVDGGPADETVQFALDGVGYEIDLSAANATRMREALAPYVGHARKAARSGRRTARAPRAGQGRSAEIRAWARAQGIAVNERGRIPADLAARFDAAH
jgi:hypothetical protein